MALLSFTRAKIFQTRNHLLGIEWGTGRPWIGIGSVCISSISSPRSRSLACIGLRVPFTFRLRLELFQFFDYIIHRWPKLGIPGKTPRGKISYFLRNLQRILTFKAIVQNAEHSSLVSHVRFGPFYQIVFPRRSILVDCSTARQHFKEDNSKTIDIALGSQMTYTPNDSNGAK